MYQEGVYKFSKMYIYFKGLYDFSKWNLCSVCNACALYRNCQFLGDEFLNIQYTWSADMCTFSKIEKNAESLHPTNECTAYTCYNRKAIKQLKGILLNKNHFFTFIHNILDSQKRIRLGFWSSRAALNSAIALWLQLGLE